MGIRTKHTDLLVGLFAFFGLAIMAFLVLQFGGFRDRLRPKYEIIVSFEDGSGILPGAPVRLAGRKVGYVADEPQPTEDYQRVHIPLRIFDDVRIPKNSRISLATAGLMGDTFIKVEIPKKGALEFIDPEAPGVVDGYAPAGLSQLQENAAEISIEAKQALVDIRAAIQDIRTAVQGLDSSFDKIDQGLLSEQNLGNVRDTLTDLRATGANLKTATAKLDTLLEEGKGAAAEAKNAFTKAGEVMDKAGGVVDKAEPAIDDLRAALKNANATIDKLSKGSGVAAALINDSSIKSDLASLISNLNRHGLLFYKNDAEKVEARKKSEGSPQPAKRQGLFRRN